MLASLCGCGDVEPPPPDPAPSVPVAVLPLRIDLYRSSTGPEPAAPVRLTVLASEEVRLALDPNPDFTLGRVSPAPGPGGSWQAVVELQPAPAAQRGIGIFTGTLFLHASALRDTRWYEVFGGPTAIPYTHGILPPPP